MHSLHNPLLPRDNPRTSVAVLVFKNLSSSEMKLVCIVRVFAFGLKYHLKSSLEAKDKNYHDVQFPVFLHNSPGFFFKAKISGLVRVSSAVVKRHGQKQLGEKKGLFFLLFHITVYHWRKLGQEAGGRCWYWSYGDCFLACSACLLEPRANSWEMAPPRKGWALINH